MYKAYKYRIYPTTEQEILLAKSFGCARWFWNYALNLCQETYKNTGKGLTRGYIQGLLPALKKEYAWLTETYSQCLQVVALNLSTAYKNFFDKKAMLPKFKSKHGKQSITYPQNVKFDGDKIYLPKIDWVYYQRHRDFAGDIKTVTVSRNPDGKYFVSVLVDVLVVASTGRSTGDSQPNPELVPVDKAVGIDVGLSHFAITSDGSKFGNPKFFVKHQRNLKRKQHKLFKKKKGSQNRKKAKLAVAKVHAKIARCREDFLHKLSRKIVNENQVIAVENLSIKGLVKNHNLAQAISDAGWGMFCTMLKYKAEGAGKQYIEIDRWFPSSKTCHVCLSQIAHLSLDVRTWTCKHCGTRHDRDVNAAINIRNEALRLRALGTSASACGGDVSRSGKTSVLLDAIPVESGSQCCNA
ncbi:MAG: RNA-guided endonuclease InsQ/TnpB family protein [Pseudanabaenaceae cyanobacterium]|jgi:putative transposase